MLSFKFIFMLKSYLILYPKHIARVLNYRTTEPFIVILILF